MGRGYQVTYLTSGYAQFYCWIQQRLYETVIVTVLSNKSQLFYVCFQNKWSFWLVRDSLKYRLYLQS